MGRALLVVVLLLGALHPASAEAVTFEGLPAALTVADRAWPTSPCVGKVQAVPAPLVEGGLAGEALGLHVNDDGTWTLISCTIGLDPDVWAAMPPYQRCLLVVHETGHLAGHRHEEGGVMGVPRGDYAPCRPMRERIEDALLARHPGGSVLCDGWQGRVLPCEVTVGRKTIRYRVRTRGDAFAIARVVRHRR